MVLSRRTLLTVSAATVATTGCIGSDPGSGSTETPAHTVSVYLAEREATRNVTVTVRSASGETLFEDGYSLSDANEAEEDGTFPASTEPETVVVDVDGRRFERRWPGFEEPGLPCDGEGDDGNRAGIELYIEGGPDEEPTVRMETNCQRVTMDRG